MDASGVTVIGFGATGGASARREIDRGHPVTFRNSSAAAKVATGATAELGPTGDVAHTAAVSWDRPTVAANSAGGAGG